LVEVQEIGKGGKDTVFGVAEIFKNILCTKIQ